MKPENKKRLFIPLFFKITTIFIFIIVLTLIAQIYITTFFSQRRIESEVEDQAMLLLSSLEWAVAPLIENNNYNAVQRLIENIGSYKSVKLLRVYTADFTVTASNNPFERGKIIEERVVADIFAGNKLKEVFKDLKNNKYFVAIPVRGQKYNPLTKSDTTAALFLESNVLFYKELSLSFSSALIRLTILSAFLLSLIIFLFADRWIFRPLRVFSKAVNEITRGNYSYKLNLKQNDEIGRFASLFEEMAKSRKEFENKLYYRAEIANLITTIAGKFVNLPAEKIDEEITNALRSIGEFLNLKRSFLLFPDNINFMNDSYEWCAPGTASRIKEYVNIDNSHIARVINNMKNPFPNPNKDFLIEKNHNSFDRALVPDIIIPVTIQRGQTGFLGFDLTENKKKYIEEASLFLKLFAEILTQLIQRQISEGKAKDLYISMDADLKTAATVQKFLIPEWLTLENNLLFSSNYSPSSSVGGDIFDIIKISPSKFIVYIGDISGHGVQAALLMTAVKSVIRIIIETEGDYLEPFRLIGRLNRVLSSQLLKKNYLTLLLSSVDLSENTLKYYTAGHPPLLKYDRKTGKAGYLKSAGGVPLGWQTEYLYKSEDQIEEKLTPDSLFLFYTDGIFEACSSDSNELGLSGLKRVLEKTASQDNMLYLPNMIISELEEANYDITRDDFTLLTVQFLPDMEYIEKAKKKYSGLFSGKRVLFKISAVLENINEVCIGCEDFIIKNKYDKKTAHDVHLVVNEFLNNIVIHGLSADRESTIILEVSITDKIILRFLDKGIDWKPDLTWHIKDKLFKNPDLSASGRGMKIIQTIADDFKRKRYADLNETVIIIA